MQLLKFMLLTAFGMGILFFIIKYIKNKKEGYHKDSFYYKHPIDWFWGWFISLLVIYGAVFGIIQMVAISKSYHTEVITYDLKIVSIQDNSQVNGKFSGRVFYSRGYINEVEYFSYYIDNGNGSYSLAKKEADRSVVIPDATTNTAYVRITDEITICKAEQTWYSISECDSRSGIYIHGEFHVPVDTINNDFTLDAK